MTNKESIPVAVYYRCSSPQQELSVQEQRSEVEGYCRGKGYRIVKEYIDEGISASKDAEKRTAFNKMIADSKDQTFKVVVCYDAARFTRFDNIEGSTPKQILRTNGIILDTVKEGVFDWRSPEGRWKDMAYCENNKAAALNLSRDSLRGRKGVIALGYWPSGVIPYGYDKEVTDGVRTVFCRRHEKFSKGRNWHTRLVVNDAEAEIVKEIFRRFVNGESRRQIALDLTNRKIQPPKGQHGRDNGSWDTYNVRTVLRDKAYIGIASIGNGQNRNRKTSAHNRTEVIEKEGSCPVIVDEHIWHEAQEEHTKRKDGGRKPQSARCGILSGFLLCGHCGYRLNKRGNKRPSYMCASASMRPHLNCKYWQIHEDILLSRVTSWLLKEVDAELLASLQAEPGEEGNIPDEVLLQGQIELLETKVKSGTESALLAPAAAREAAWKLVTGWTDELASLKQKLSLIEAVRNEPALQGFSAWWEKVKDTLVRIPATWTEPKLDEEAELIISDRLTSPVEVDRADLRAFLAKLGFEVKIWWEVVGTRRSETENVYGVKDVQISISVDLSDQSFSTGSSATFDHKRFVICGRIAV